MRRRIYMSLLLIMTALLVACGTKEDKAKSRDNSAKVNFSDNDNKEKEVEESHTAPKVDDSKDELVETTESIPVGIYVKEQTSEVDGYSITSYNAIVLYDNGVGYYIGDMLYPATWDKEGIEVEGVKYPMNYTDGKLTLKYAEFSKYEGKVVVPEGFDKREDNITEGILPVEFDFDGLSEQENGYDIKCTVFVQQIYDIVDIAKLEAGDAIIVGDAFVIVDSITEDGGMKIINGGIDEEGIELMPYDEDNCYRVWLPNDYCTYTCVGQYVFSISDKVVITDETEPGNPVKTDYSGLVDVLNWEYSFNVFNTRIRVENGEIVDIHRYFTP